MNKRTPQASTRSWTLPASGALIAFAGNSVLCRLALGTNAIDAASFTGIRLVSGALVLWLLLKCSVQHRSTPPPRRWSSAALLFCYAAAFSFAYTSLATGTGALILFGSVQLTMIIAGLMSGERLRRTEWMGGFLAFGGLIYLLSPGVTAPPLSGSLLMAGAGLAWGLYSLRGRETAEPLATTTRNFVLAIPLALILELFFLSQSYLSFKGVLLAILSGGLASGIGYATWYVALRRMTVTRAAIVQLAVPVLAALGGTIFLSEEISPRLIIASLFILSGIGLTGASHKPSLPVKTAD